MPTTIRTSTDWDVTAEHHHTDGSRAPMDDIGLELGEPSAAFSDLIAAQQRTFRCSCGETVTVNLMINMKQQLVAGDD
jgi:hypothetical protein